MIKLLHKYYKHLDTQKLLSWLCANKLKKKTTTFNLSISINQDPRSTTFFHKTPLLGPILHRQL